ncbi:MAG: helix-turn-helix protein [Acidobacteriota bacterium]|nr:helix-turn-helix protein [Acidobacteriota bacterium]
MGTSRRPRPARLASKLAEIRAKLGLTQAEMFERLGDTGTRLYVGHIDDYEKDRRVPTLQVVLAYARAAGVTMEEIVDDELDLPKRRRK